MYRDFSFILAFLAGVLLFSCSKKSHPARTPKPEVNINPAPVKKTDSVTVKTEAPKKKPKEHIPIPKVITVNDSAAHKSVDGRYYYDVMGHRYWRNNKDGKYYLFDKSMYTNDDFKPK